MSPDQLLDPHETRPEVVMTQVRDAISLMAREQTRIADEQEKTVRRLEKLEWAQHDESLKAMERERAGVREAQLLKESADDKAAIIQHQLDLDRERRDREQTAQRWFIVTAISAAVAIAGIADRIMVWLS